MKGLNINLFYVYHICTLWDVKEQGSEIWFFPLFLVSFFNKFGTETIVEDQTKPNSQTSLLLTFRSHLVEGFLL